MKKIVDIDTWKEFVKDNIEALQRENFYYTRGYDAALEDATKFLVDMPDAEEKKLDKTKKYTINYGYGRAVLYTPYDCKERFYTLANTCFGIRKSIAGCDIIKTEDAEIEDFERLEFSGDIYVWREDGARKNIQPFFDEDWNEDYCEECRYTGEEE